MVSGNRILFLCLTLFIWRNANGLGVWQNRPANYWQSGGVSKSFGDTALSPAQQGFSSSASGVQTAVGDVGSAQPLSTSGRGDSVANVPGFLRQYTISQDQNVLSPFGSFPQSQAGYTALSSVSSGGLSLPLQSTANQAALGFQNQLVSSPVSSAPSSASQSLSSQQSSLQFASPGQATSSLPQSFTANYVFGTQTQPSSPGTVSLSVASDFPTTSQQASSGSQSAVGTLYAQPSNWYSFTLGQAPSQSATASYKPVSQSQSSASQSSALQQSSLQLASPSQGTATVPGIQVQTSSPVTSTLSLASNLPTTSQQATSGSQLATGTLYGQPSSWYSFTLGQTPSQTVTASYKPVSLPQGSASQTSASQQSSLQLVSPSLGSSSLPQSLSSSYVFGSGTQPSSPGTVSLSVASDVPTTSQQASSGSQSAAGALYGQPSSWYSFTLGQTPAQSVTTSYKPVSSSQGSASQTSASPQSSLSSSSQVTTSVSQSLPSSYVSGIQAQYSSPVTSTLSLASNLPTSSQQASSGSQLATGTLYGQPSSWFSSTQGQSFQTASQFGASPDRSASSSQGSVSLSSSTLQTPSQFQATPYKPVFTSQGSASQSLTSQQSSLQVTSPSQGVSSQPLTQTQPSRPVTVPLSVASDFPTTSQQASSVSQSAAGTLYGQPSSWYSFTQGQTPSQSVTTSYKPVSLPQGTASQSFASQQSSLQLGSPSLGTASVPAIQMQSSSPVTSTLSLTSNLPTSSQAQTSYVSQSATDPLHGQASSWYSSSQGQGVQIASRSADAPNTLGVAVIGVYTAGPAQWYRVDPFGRTSQINVLPSPSQATGSLGSQAASSSSTTTSQSQSTTGSVGFGFQSQSAPASTVSLTQGAAQLPTLTQGAAQLPTLTQGAAQLPTLTQGAAQLPTLTQGAAQLPTLTQGAAQLPSFTAANPSASVSQPSQGEQSSWRSSGVSTSFGQSSSGQVAPVATTQQFSSGWQGPVFSGTFPSQSASTSPSSGSYGSTFQSRATQVGSFDQFSQVSSPLSVASTFTKGIPTSFGLLQGYSSQPIDFRPATQRGNDFLVN